MPSMVEAVYKAKLPRILSASRMRWIVHLPKNRPMPLKIAFDSDIMYCFAFLEVWEDCTLCASLTTLRSTEDFMPNEGGLSVSTILNIGLVYKSL